MMALPVQRHIQRRLFAVSDAEEAQHLPVKSGPIALITIIVVGYPVHPVHLFLLLLLLLLLPSIVYFSRK